MRFEHEIEPGASREALWNLLRDFKSVVQCLPGVESVEEVDATTYQGSMRVRVGPMGLTLSGTVELDHDESRGLWKMAVQARDRRVGGGARATIETAITGDERGTVGLRVSSDVQLMGRLGELGQPLIRRKADSMFKEFAENLKALVSDS